MKEGSDLMPEYSFSGPVLSKVCVKKLLFMQARLDNFSLEEGYRGTLKKEINNLGDFNRSCKWSRKFQEF